MPKLNFYKIGGKKHKEIDVTRKFVDPEGCRKHWHDCCEVELVISGKGTHTVNGTKHEIKVGDFYLLTPCDCHNYSIEEPTELYGIMFEDKYVSPGIYERILTGKSQGIDHFVNLDEVRRETVERLFLSLIDEFDRLDGSRDMPLFDEYAARIVDCLMIQMLRAYESESEQPAGIGDSHISAAILYIHRHSGEAISLTDVANEVHLSSGYFSELFKNATGQNFKSYLIDLRMRNACRLLANTELSVTDICFECGFESFSNFMRTFKARYGISPLKFRASNKSEIMQ